MDIASFWKISDNPPIKPDCFIVLSYAVENKNDPTKPTAAAIKLAVEWWKKFPKSKIIMSTGDNQFLGIPNSRVMKNYAVRIGVPDYMIIEEPKSKDTYQNLIYSMNIAKEYNLINITFVMYDLHVRRMLKIAKKIGIGNYSWVSVGGNGSPAYGLKYIQTYSRLTILIYEMLAYIYNIIKGQI